MLVRHTAKENVPSVVIGYEWGVEHVSQKEFRTIVRKSVARLPRCRLGSC